MVFANILEMFLCRCFQSLAPGILEEYFGKAKYPATSLNVVPPLLQEISLAPSRRTTSHISDMANKFFGRHIYINPENKKVDDDLKIFLDGGYILDDGSCSNIFPPTTVKRSRASSSDGSEPEQPRGKKYSE
ncbi:uncharacterized protein BO95DRAFT_466299 [Aspergillus brunneoviolaceus CBS 621.78]|uniref:Uncharacterized protein n=1 Tax=Aspergillus brunneoviolaceus CBS 621.78 TaxID=1450534 RepID=A0ACD1G1F8_9EURO|nr:hypothetical protein BO95DRAFT_466299 [Aspergillus brunneoviolaceus CBS 621.78]RAH43108.1 hypothetical protein BO95DRAFT_466299 [Aspergillus brunneoviolaceus CBS 621.78]